MEDICKEKIKKIDECLQKHEERLDALEHFQIRFEVQIENLCKKIESLISSIRNAGIFLMTTLIVFFIWYIQSLPRG